MRFDPSEDRSTDDPDTYREYAFQLLLASVGTLLEHEKWEATAATPSPWSEELIRENIELASRNLAQAVEATDSWPVGWKESRGVRLP